MSYYTEYRTDAELTECDACCGDFAIEDLHIREIAASNYPRVQIDETRYLCDECVESFDTRSYRLNRNTIVAFAAMALLSVLAMLWVLLAASMANLIVVIAAIYLLVNLAVLGKLAMLWLHVRREYPLRLASGSPR